MAAGFLVLLFLLVGEAEGGRRASMPHQVAHVKRVFGEGFELFHGGERMNQKTE
jgi:hypothetical protein